METKSQNYTEAFEGQFETANGLSQRRRKAMESIVGLFSQRIDCETAYSQGLLKIAKAQHSLSQG